MIRYINDKTTMMAYMDERLEQRSPKRRLELLNEMLDRHQSDISQMMMLIIDRLKRQTDILKSRLRNPEDLILHQTEVIHRLHEFLKHHIMTILKDRYHAFQVYKTGLEGNNPLRLMDRGYSIIKKHEKVITSVNDISIGDQLSIHLKDGIADTKVIGKKGT